MPASPPTRSSYSAKASWLPCIYAARVAAGIRPSPSTCPVPIGVTPNGPSSGSAARAAAIGPSTANLTELILESQPHPEQGYRACIGILRLGRQYGAARLEAACDRGLDIGARSYGSIQSILKHGLDKQPARAARQSELLPDHPNIRGSRYYP